MSDSSSQASSSGGGLRQKLGSLLQNLGGRTSSSRPEETWKQEQTFFLTEEIIKELSSETPLSLRLRAVKEFQEIVTTKRLEQFAIQSVWLELKDLLEPDQPTEARQLVLYFLQALISGQYEELGILRAHFFRVIQNHSVIEDFQQCFDVIYTLTDNGKDIRYLEQDIVLYLMKSFSSAINYGRCIEYLTMLVNLIKHNTSYIEEEHLVNLIHGSCQLITSSNQLPVSELSLEVIDSIVCYSSVPVSSLLTVSTTLCLTINVVPLQNKTREISLRLLGTHVGHATVFTLCKILKERSNWTNPLLLRGAVFCISMSLWSSQKIDSLKISFSSVLPFIQEVSKCDHTIVMYEISLSLLRLVRAHVHNFHSIEWECLYSTLENIQEHLLQLELQRDDETNVLVQVIQELFDKIATYHTGNNISIVVDCSKFFSVIDKAISLHQLPLVIKLITYKINGVMVGSSEWIDYLLSNAKRFYNMKSDTILRLHVLDLLKELVDTHLMCYETELLEGVVSPLLTSVCDDEDEDVQCKAIQLLIAILNDSTPKWTPLILAIIDAVLQKGLQLVALETNKENLKLPASKAAVFGLTPLLKSKLCSSSDISAQVFHLLINYLQQQIEEEYFIPATCVMRIKIFNCILSLRANKDGMIGYCDADNDAIVYSPFYTCEKPDRDACSEMSSEENVEMYLNCNKVFSAVLSCITKEREWAVLVEVLLGLNKVLADRKLTLSSIPNLSILCQNLCHIANNHQEYLYNVPSKPTHDLVTYLYPVLATLCNYGDYLDRASRNSLVCCLEKGVVGSCGLLCIRALSIATLEMQMTMARLLPRVLYRIGQVVATPKMAIPVLELLANIVGLRSLYNGFVEQQYLGVFGIALPYMDQSKYKSYVVAMAHHVIVMWFIKCRIQYRPVIAKFINKSLMTLLAFHKNSDAPRKRSISFTSSTQHYQQIESPLSTNKEEVFSFQDNLMNDMTEVCIDMMARYTFSNVSTQPIRSPAADFLVRGGPSKTWLLGNALVTITTSGTGGGVQGVCPRCKAVQNSLQPNPSILLAPPHTDDSTLCSCWCRGWAEIKVRRPTGNVAWLMRLQNKLDILATPQPDGDYDKSLLGLNRPTQSEVEGEMDDDDDDDDEWGIIEQNDILDQSHDIEKQSHDVEKQSHDIEKQSYDQLHDLEKKSHDLLHDTKEQSHDVEKQSNDIEKQSHDLLHDTKESHDVEKQSNDIEKQSHDLLHDTKESHDVEKQSLDKQSENDDSANNSCLYGQSHDSSSNQLNYTPPDRMYIKLTRDVTPPRRGTSQSWSEDRNISSTNNNHVSFRSHSICSASLHQLPPLFSYDEGHLLGRSPSLVSDMLSAPEQLELMTTVSKMADGYSNDTNEIGEEPLEPSTVIPTNTSVISLTIDTPTADIKSDIESVITDTKLPLADSADSSLPDIKLSPSDATADIELPSATNDVSLTDTEESTIAETTQSSLTDNDSTKVDISLNDTKSDNDSTKVDISLNDTKSDLTKVDISPSHTTEDITTSSRKISSTPTRSRKRVMFSQAPPTSLPREDMLTDVFNNPSFIFLQLYHHLGTLPSDTPLLLPSSENVERAMKVLDHIPPYNTHKIGVVYVGIDQTTEQDILSNTSGSYRYLMFLRGLGQIIKLSECVSNLVYLGGLETDGIDGELACFWEDDITQVMFHVATLMPTNPSNLQCSNKKLHIGNNFVTIVYNDSNRQFQFGTIKGQFNYVEVIIEPRPCGMNYVTVSVKEDLDDLIDCTPSLISDKSLPLLVRQKALLANLACLVISESAKGCYPSNWLGRLRQIQHIREKILSETLTNKKTTSPITLTPPATNYQYMDFTQYC